ncbi:hypothetical protein SKAU_G00063400 [Synaphobranchus kaupii]|uniref:Uncharacterized protein n=1 Tax=Synaphobranchus kaupii TaxID=118154 RepID=A0A9Q1G5H3_SYNKA|nr:hypothetical protein SKAU_G00063400 [Synaphobranchus kaupii]
MATAMVIKPKNVQMKTRSNVTETKVRTLETKPKGNTDPRKKRASSCPRYHHSNECETKKTDDHRTKIVRKTEPTVASKKPRETTSDQKQHVHKTRHRTVCELPSQKAFTVIAPNQKKRHEIQRKAEAELAALEDFKLSRAMGYVSIAPSKVGGCLTLKEVRNKQQQEMQMSQKQKQVKRCVTKPSVLQKL